MSILVAKIEAKFPAMNPYAVLFDTVHCTDCGGTRRGSNNLELLQTQPREYICPDCLDDRIAELEDVCPLNCACPDCDPTWDEPDSQWTQAELDEVDRTTDWDQWDSDRRERLAESLEV